MQGGHRVLKVLEKKLSVFPGPGKSLKTVLGIKNIRKMIYKLCEKYDYPIHTTKYRVGQIKLYYLSLLFVTTECI